jgi:protein FRA10AC1
MRWRTKDEVLSGKGQFTCASLSCSRRDDVIVNPEPDEDNDSRNERASGKLREEGAERGLQTFELNFGYVEEGIKKNALVKVRVCQRCARRLGEVQGATTRGKRRRSRSRDRSRSHSRRRERSPDSRRRRKRERRRRRASPGEEGPSLRNSSRPPSPDRTLSVP